PPNPQHKHFFAVLAGVIALGFLCASAQAQVIISTSGSSNPTSAGYFENFNFNGDPGSITRGPGTDTENYWYLHTGPFPGDSGGGHYQYNMNPGDDTNPLGWTFTYRAKAVNANQNFESYFAVLHNGGFAHIGTLLGGP